MWKWSRLDFKANGLASSSQGFAQQNPGCRDEPFASILSEPQRGSVRRRLPVDMRGTEPHWGSHFIGDSFVRQIPRVGATLGLNTEARWASRCGTKCLFLHRHRRQHERKCGLRATSKDSILNACRSIPPRSSFLRPVVSCACRRQTGGSCLMKRSISRCAVI